MADNGFYTTVGFIRGPWYVFNFAYQIAVSIAALLVLLTYAFRAPEKARRQSLALVAGGRAPGTAILVGDVTERARLVQRLTELAETDRLTGILNRRSLTEAGERELGGESCTDQSVGIVMIDLDHFKSVNDRYGHEAGDEVIKAAVERWKTCLRGVDILGRYGGEEFVAILPGADLKGSLAMAERMRASLASCPVAAGGREVAMTASFGVHCDAQASFAENLRLADEAMYRAKERGRNRVEGAE